MISFTSVERPDARGWSSLGAVFLCLAGCVQEPAEIERDQPESRSPSESRVLVQPPDSGSRFLQAAAAGDEILVTALIDTGIDPDFRSDSGTTALMLAAAGGHRRVVDVLIAQGADHRLRDSSGKTAAEFARDAGHAEIVESLKKPGTMNQ